MSSSAVKECEVTHLTEQQLNGYANRTLGAAELLQVDDHLTACRDCCERLQSVLQASTGENGVVNSLAWELTTSGEDFHLSFEQISAFLESQLDEIDREIITSHLAVCANCVAEVEDLQAFKEVITAQLVREAAAFSPPVPAPSRWERWKNFRSWPARWVLMPLTAVLCGAAIIIAITWRQPHPSIARQETTRPPTPLPSASTAVPATSTVPEATPEKTAAPFSSEERAIHLALATGRVEVAADIKRLQSRGAGLMSGRREKTSFAVLSPQGNLVESTTPHLLWAPLPQAKSYVVTVTDQQFKQVAQSSPLTQAGWTLSAKLARGQTYQWQVTATTEEGKEITAPLPSAPEAKFKVLDNESFNLLQRLRPRYAGAHLELGIIYARLGLLDDAAHEFRLEKARPQLAQRLLNSLSQQRN